MPAAFDELALRLANTVAAPWAQVALSYTPVDVSAYEVLFKQVGFVLPAVLKAELATRGAFELRAVPDAEEEHHETDEGVDASEALSDLRGPLWAGRNVLRGGVHLLSPAELFGTYRGQRLGTRGQVELGSLWVFAAPRGYVWVDAFALDARAGSSRVDGEYPVVPFHEDDMGEEFDLLEPDGSLRHARPSLDAWARWVSDEIENTVKALEAAGVTRVAAPGPKGPTQVVDLAPYLAEVAQGQKWSSWVEAIWRQALRQGSVEAAQQVLRDVGTMDTRPSEADYKLPGALDLWHRLPRHGPFSRRAALAELWADRKPEGDAETQVAFDVFLGSLEHDHVAPLAVFDALQPAAWSDRGLATAAATRWARALLWALGPAEPAHLHEAATLVHRPEDGNRRDTELALWLRLEPFARRAGVL